MEYFASETNVSEGPDVPIIRVEPFLPQKNGRIRFLWNTDNLYQNPRSHIPEDSTPPYFSFPASYRV